MKISLAILTMNEIAGCRVIVDRIPLDAVDEHATSGSFCLCSAGQDFMPSRSACPGICCR